MSPGGRKLLAIAGLILALGFAGARIIPPRQGREVPFSVGGAVEDLAVPWQHSAAENAVCAPLQLALQRRRPDAVLRLWEHEPRLHGDACAELHRALALFAQVRKDRRSIDLPPALEALLTVASRPEDHTPIVRAALHFDVARIAEELPAPHAAIQHYRLASQLGFPVEWGAEQRAQEVELKLARRRSQIAATKRGQWPALPGAEELALSEAIPGWLSDTNANANALSRLAAALRERHDDPWLSEVLQLPRDEQLELVQAAVARRAGQPVAAPSNPRSAAGLAIRWEAAEAARSVRRPISAREYRWMIAAATQRRYRWLSGRMRLTEIWTRTQARNQNVQADRLRLLRELATQPGSLLRLEARFALGDPVTSANTPASAWHESRESLNEFWAGLHRDVVAVTPYISLALSSSAEGYPLTAAMLAREAGELATASANPRLPYAVWLDLGGAELRRRRFQHATAAFEEGLRVAPKPLPVAGQALLALSRAHVAWEAGRHAEAATMLAALPLRFPYESASYYNRLRLLPAAGLLHARLGHREEARRHFAEAVRWCRERMGPAQSSFERRFVQREASESWDGMVETLFANGDAAGSLALWREYRSGYRAAPAEPLIAGEQRVIFAPIGDRILAWSETQAGIRSHVIARGDLPQTATRWISLLSDPRTEHSTLAPISARLYSELLGWASPQQARILTIDAVDWLSTVPWEALDGGSGPLLARTALVHGSAAGASRSGRRSSPALLIADPDLSREQTVARRFPPLPAAAAEVERLRSRLVGANVRAGKPVTAPEITRLLPGVRLFHFAGHGSAEFGSGGLVTTPSPAGHLLRPADILPLDLSRLDLAVLAACASERGEQGTRLTLDSLVLAFLERGARGVVAARWAVDSRATAVFMDQFYRRLLRGDPPAECVRGAAEVLRDSPRTSAAYYWGAFYYSR